jgi:hypothetical protein
MPVTLRFEEVRHAYLTAKQDIMLSCGWETLWDMTSRPRKGYSISTIVVGIVSVVKKV